MPAAFFGELTTRSIGNFSPVNASKGRLTDSTRKLGRGRPAKAMVSMGTRNCCASHEARAMLPWFSLPSERSTTRGTMPPGSAAMASRTAASRSVPRPASPEVGCRVHLRLNSPDNGCRDDRANGITRIQWRPRAASIFVATSDARARSAGEILAEVSTSTATAIFDSGSVRRG